MLAEVYRTANWTQGCIELYGNTTIDGLVDRIGHPVDVRDGLAWGISRDACYKYCGPDLLQQVSMPRLHLQNGPSHAAPLFPAFDSAQTIMLTKPAIDFHVQALCTSFYQFLTALARADSTTTI